MSLVDVAEHRIKLLFKKSEGKATENDLKQLNRLAKLMSETASPVTSKEEKVFLRYAEKVISILENKSASPEDLTDLDFTKK